MWFESYSSSSPGFYDFSSSPWSDPEMKDLTGELSLGIVSSLASDFYFCYDMIIRLLKFYSNLVS